jgi:GT2 family glycosyltransferase
MSTQLSADIVIPTRGRGALLDATLRSLRDSTLGTVDIWVADQSDDDATQRAVAPHAGEDPRVHYLRLESRGISPGRNEGAAAGRAPFILFTDDDCVATPGWAGTLARELRQDAICMAFGRVLPDDTYHPPIPPGATPASRAIPMALKDAPARRVYGGNRFDLSFGHGASMGIRRDWLAELGGFDDMLGVGCPLKSFDDRDIGYRTLARGGRIVYTPEALTYHRHWRSWQSLRRAYRDYAIGAGAAAGKYIRCGDAGGWYILLEWVADQGVRQAASGLLKWRSWQKIQVGLFQIAYPWVGLARGARLAVDRPRLMYRSA